MILQKTLPIKERVFHGKRFDFLALGGEEIRDFIHVKPYLVISVTDPKTPDAEIALPQNLIDVLRLKFDDVGKPYKFQFEKSSDVLMTSDEASQILEFVKKYVGEIKMVVCRCEQGISRSSAMAAALSRVLQGEDGYFLKNYVANNWVYDLLIESAKDFDFSQSSSVNFAAKNKKLGFRVESRK